MCNYLLQMYLGIVFMVQNVCGVLYMLLMIEVGFGFGGVYGQGVLCINNVMVDYYFVIQVSVGFQIGVQ